MILILDVVIMMVTTPTHIGTVTIRFTGVPASIADTTGGQITITDPIIHGVGVIITIIGDITHLTTHTMAMEDITPVTIVDTTTDTLMDITMAITPEPTVDFIMVVVTTITIVMMVQIHITMDKEIIILLTHKVSDMVQPWEKSMKTM
jgi:hypothetical protein